MSQKLRLAFVNSKIGLSNSMTPSRSSGHVRPQALPTSTRSSDSRLIQKMRIVERLNPGRARLLEEIAERIIARESGELAGAARTD